MAGGFSGMPLGSFSGRGADFQPMQFFLEQRRLAAQAEAQRKQQAAAQQQSFVMALMAKKQQEAELAQQAQQFQASQQARAAEKQMAAEQFAAEQRRLEAQAKMASSLDARRLGISEAEQRRLEARDREQAADVDQMRALRQSSEDRQRQEFEWEKNRRAEIDKAASEQAAKAEKYKPTKGAGAAYARTTLGVSRPKEFTWDLVAPGYMDYVSKRFPGDPEAQQAWLDGAREEFEKAGRGTKDAARDVERVRRNIENEINDISDDLMKYEKFAADYEGTPQGVEYAKKAAKLNDKLEKLRERRSQLS